MCLPVHLLACLPACLATSLPVRVSTTLPACLCVCVHTLCPHVPCAVRRFSNAEEEGDVGVTNPSQRRYVHYFQQIVTGHLQVSPCVCVCVCVCVSACVCVFEASGALLLTVTTRFFSIVCHAALLVWTIPIPNPHARTHTRARTHTHVCVQVWPKPLRLLHVIMQTVPTFDKSKGCRPMLAVYEVCQPTTVTVRAGWAVLFDRLP